MKNIGKQTLSIRDGIWTQVNSQIATKVYTEISVWDLTSDQVLNQVVTQMLDETSKEVTGQGQ